MPLRFSKIATKICSLDRLLKESTASITSSSAAVVYYQPLFDSPSTVATMSAADAAIGKESLCWRIASALILKPCTVTCRDIT
jgi:hypothetical protein